MKNTPVESTFFPDFYDFVSRRIENGARVQDLSGEYDMALEKAIELENVLQQKVPEYLKHDLSILISAETELSAANGHMCYRLGFADGIHFAQQVLHNKASGS